MGRKEGVWRVYNKKGDLLNTIEFRNGVDVRAAAAVAERKAAEKKQADKNKSTEKKPNQYNNPPPQAPKKEAPKKK